jgi:RNA polymerase sigma-70 factor, ECF subfamily
MVYDLWPLSNPPTLFANPVSKGVEKMTHAAIVNDASAGESEDLLIARATRGDREATRALYNAHVRRVHRLAYRLCGDEEMAQDFTQDTFVRVFQKLETFRGDAAFGTWVHRIAVTVTLNGLRKERRLARRSDNLDAVADMASAPASAIEPDLRAKLAAAIEALPESCRTSVVLHDLEGYTHAEIGAMLGIAEGTSKARLFDARNRLRKTLSQFSQER